MNSRMEEGMKGINLKVSDKVGGNILIMKEGVMKVNGKMIR